ncbi:hypothetical protein B0J12DRAFT_600002 [Macrophomina phaseolina]|uniref:C2H2-type domain-containing protein n=1 Tax=Macrophomina phaseolina TaxID=35725 RepID=A0ABQ8GCT4_9PEZI|nr:hypothetical protein B0J12DRAFT_600002 [Macrophomina phaseolina]
MDDLLIPRSAGTDEHPFGFTKTGRPRRVYKCRDCSRIFKRSEHCARHERVHTRERPFACRFCNKKYARKDLVTRHERSLHPQETAAAGDFRPRRTSQSASTVSVRSNSQNQGPTISQGLSSEGTSPDEFSQNGPQTPQDLDDLTVRRNSFPITLSRMMSPSFFNSDDFLPLEAGQNCDGQYSQPRNAEQTEKHASSLHESPRRSFSLPNAMADLDSSPMSVAAEQTRVAGSVEDVEISHAPQLGNTEAMEQDILFGRMDGFLMGPTTQPLPDNGTAYPFPGINAQNDASTHNLPRVMRERVASPPKLRIDCAVHDSLYRDIRGRVKGELEENVIPRVKELERLVEAYIKCFHCHFPIIHFASLDLSTTPGPLLLSICAIGALYRLERRRAVQFHNLASSALHSANEFQLKRTALQKGRQDISRLSWDEWILRESTKRLLCGIFITGNLFSVTYGTTPVFSIEQDLQFEMPSEEKLWDAQTAELWEDVRASRNASDYQITLRQAVVSTLFDRKDHFGPAPSQVSGFTALLITHAANVHMWSILQFVQAFSPPLANEILASTFSALQRWHAALGNGRVEAPESAYYNNAGIPLVFNCYALLRIAYVRLFGNGDIFNKMVLVTDDLEEISATMSSYVAAPQPRSHFLTKAISRAYEGFITPVRLGHLLIKKTAALSWSVEHAVAAWDSVLFVSKWVHALQLESATRPPDEEENSIIMQLRELLDEMEYDYEENGSLAAAVTRAWAGFLTDTWVWGVTPRMGYTLMQLAAAYEKSYEGLSP